MRTEQVMFTEVTTNDTPYVEMIPIVFDDEPTLNDHVRQTYLAEMKAHRQAEKTKAKAEHNALAERKSAVATKSVSRTSEPARQTVTFEATAYIALCDTGCIGITATGIDVRRSIYYGKHRIIAVDPNVIPLGSLVRVTLADGTTFTASAQDTGGRIRGHIVDILVSSESEAWAFGRQAVSIQILRNGAD